MRNKRVKEMALYAVFIALIAIESFTPIGFIPIGTSSITTLHVLVILMAFLTDTKGGFVAGLTFGICSLLRAVIAPASATDILFRNPLVSILPRVIFGLLAGLTASYLNKKFGDSLAKKTVLIVVSSVVLTFIHTALVLPMMYLFAPSIPEFSNFWNENTFIVFFWGVLVANGFLEMLVAGIIVPICTIPLNKVMERV